MMDKCRICLGNKKTLRCIFETCKNISFADMMVSIANIKIGDQNGITNKICRSCRKTLQEAYEFKLLIERSDAALNGTTNLKKIKFNNLNDLRVEIEIEFDSKQSINNITDIVNFEDGVNELCYSNTVIKKVASSKTDNVCLKPIPVLEFLKTIKDDPDDTNFCGEDYDVKDYDVDCYGVDSDDDHDYRPPLFTSDTEENIINEVKSRKRHTRSSKKFYGNPDINEDSGTDISRKGSDYDDGDYIPPDKLLNATKSKRPYVMKKPRCYNTAKAKDVCIKPVYLRDLKLIYEYPKPGKKDKQKESDGKKDCGKVCPYCGKLAKSLQSHILIHAGERKHKCDLCDKAFFTPAALRSHQKHNHVTTKDFKCDQCTAAFSVKASLESHMVMHKEEFSHVCDICNKGFKRRAAMRRHRLQHNSANKSVMCDLCNMSFFTKYGLRHHLRIHTGERPYKCEICSQPYSYKHDFNRHCLKKHGVFFKRRSVFVMNEEVLKKERILMKELMLRVNGIIKDDKPINPFEGPQAALAFEQTLKALEARQIPIDFQF